jgi:hypothetical protein
MIDKLVVAAGPLLIVGVILYVNARQNLDNVKKNWVQYRCHPAYMPFSSMFGEDTGANFSYCTNAFAKEIFGYATDPVYKLFEMFQNVIESFMNQINQYLKYLAGMDKFVFGFADTVFGKLFNTFSVFNSQIGSLRDVVGRITSSAYYAAFTINTIVDFVISFFSFVMTMIKAVVIMLFALSFILALFYPVILAFVIPLGALMGVSYCFHPDTVVSTNRGNIQIKFIKPGDILNGSKVTGKFIFDCHSSIDLYTYNGTIVSGRHIVLHDGVHKYVRETGAPLYTGERPSYLVCLNTEDNQIRIGTSIFSDYEEIDNPDSVRAIERLIFGRYVNAEGTTGLHPSTSIRYSTGAVGPIDQLKLGDKLVEGTVTGLVVLDGADTNWYVVDGVTMLGSQPIKRNGFVTLAKDLGLPLFGKKPAYAIQVFLDNEDGFFMVNDRVVVRDYPDSHDIEKMEEIQNIVLFTLNQCVKK